MLSIFKPNGVYLPLDPLYPTARLAHMLSQSRCAFVLVSKPLLPTLTQALMTLPEEKRPAVLQLEDLQIQEGRRENLPTRLHPANLAYIIYTSGSTGTPKGVMVEHRGMLNHIYAKMADVQLTGADTLAQNGPQCFDISVWQSLAALMIGGRVQVFKDEV